VTPTPTQLGKPREESRSGGEKGGGSADVLGRGMDIARPDLARERKQRRILVGAALALGLLLLTLRVSRLKPAAPAVDRSAVWIDEVKRGSMLRQVRGLGTLLPEEIRWMRKMATSSVM
jgi:HlyD family secretion protein